VFLYAICASNSSTSFSMTAAAPRLSACSRAAFSANGGRADEVDAEFVRVPDDGFVRRETTFKFTYASRSWDIGDSSLVGVCLSRTIVTDWVTRDCGLHEFHEGPSELVRERLQ
jgi:hypothetical protein